MIKGMGGAMDLVAGVKRVVVIMEHTAKSGEHKLLAECSLPLTGKNCVHRVITELCVLDIAPKGFKLVELAPGISLDEVSAKTGAPVAA
jgi:3-oxoacid CoA-transferase subunit B